MKIALIALTLAFSLPAYAEYDQVYCGKLKRVSEVKEFQQYSSLNFDYVIDMTESCVLSDPEDATYVGIYAGGAESQAKIEKIINSTRASTQWCVSGRWSGYDPCIYPSGKGNISSRTEHIYRIDRRSAFGDSVED